MRTNIKQPSLNRGQIKSDEQIEIESTRAHAVTNLTGDKEAVKRKLKRIYTHLPDDTINYMVKIFFKYR